MGTPSFGRLKRFDINPAKTVDYAITEIEGEPILTVCAIGEKNKAYFQKVMAKSARARGGQALNTQQIRARSRSYARELFPDLAIKTWEKKPPIDDDGKPVPYTAEACKAFLDALPDHILDRLIEYVSTPDNFNDGAENITREDAEGIAGN